MFPIPPDVSELMKREPRPESFCAEHSADANLDLVVGMALTTFFAIGMLVRWVELSDVIDLLIEWL